MTASSRILTLRSPAKINLWLRVGHKRPDGFHEIASLFSLLDFGDTLQIGTVKNGEPRETDGYAVCRPWPGFVFGLSVEAGYPAVCRKELEAGLKDNLALRACGLIRKQFPRLAKRSFWMALSKAVPSGAGLGGASSNAAAALKGLVRFFRLSLSQSRLEALGRALGSDVPFFLRASPSRPLWWARGRGEMLRPWTPPREFRRAWYLLVYPGFSVSTRWAYGRLKSPEKVSLTRPRILPTLPPDSVLDQPENSFEKVVFRKHPVLGRAKKFLASLGASQAALTGTGSCLYAAGRSEAECRSWVLRMKKEPPFEKFYYYVTGCGER